MTNDVCAYCGVHRRIGEDLGDERRLVIPHNHPSEIKNDVQDDFPRKHLTPTLSGGCRTPTDVRLDHRGADHRCPPSAAVCCYTAISVGSPCTTQGSSNLTF